MKLSKMLTLLAAVLFVIAAPSGAQEAEIIAPESAQIGQPLVVELIAPKEASGFKVFWLGKEASITPAPKEKYMLCRVVLGTDLLNAKAGTQEVIFSYEHMGVRQETGKTIDLQKKDYPSEKLKVAPAMVNPPKEQTERINREARLAREAVRTNTPGFAPRLPLVRPVPGIFTSAYGKSRYYNGELRSRHGGVDMRAAVGTPVKAAADGIVVLTGDFWFSGKCVYIKHGAGLISFYGHMSKLQTEKGKKIKAGEVIGLSGQSGRVTGPHLHFGLAWRGEYFDPESIMRKQ